MKNGNEQSAATVNQIEQTHPNVPHLECTLTGDIQGSLNGGINKPINCIPVMAGQRIKQLNCNVNIQLLTPLTPVFQKLRGEILTFYVPYSRVWKNSELFFAQRGGTTQSKIEEIPNIGGKKIPTVVINQGENDIPNVTGLQNTTAWRDSYIGAYYPRQGKKAYYPASDLGRYEYEQIMPPASVIPLRGYRAIWNDFLRNKEYDTAQTEYNDDQVSNSEWNSYLPSLPSDTALYTNLYNCNMRARRNNSYYTNYRTELQGQETELEFGTNPATELLDWLSIEHTANELRSQASNAQKNTWDIIAEMRGSTKLSEGKVQLLGKRTFDINYNAITQNTYNNNESVSEEFRVLGKQGAYSYTYIDLPIMAGYEAREEGYLHVILHIYADSIFESGWDRDLINIKWDSRYRPELCEQKEDVLYEIEMSTAFESTEDYGEVDFKKAVGFKRKFNEILKLPSKVTGDMCNRDYYDMNQNAKQNDNIVLGKQSYQFAQTYINRQDIYNVENTTIGAKLDIWKDYTDMLINKNLAIKQPEVNDIGLRYLGVSGENQIFYGGKLKMITELPINNEIADNYTVYGEH